MTDKELFATQCRAVATSLAQASTKLDEIFSTYFDRGYNSGGADPIIDGDVSGAGTTADELAGLITLAEQLNKWRHGTTSGVTAADYDATLNTLRTDL